MENLKINKKSEQTTATYTKGGYRVEITYNGSELTYNISGVPQSKLSEVSALIKEVNSAIAANMASEAAE